MSDKVNVLLVDDQPAKLLASEEILRELGENLVKASSAREALDFLLKNEAAVILIDVCMPELDGFQLAEMIRDHPRFQKTAIIFISAIQVADVDRLRGYELGAVDYVPVPVVPALLRAKVKVFAELYRKTQALERLNAELEGRVAARTAELEMSNAQLMQSERARSLALAAGQMGSWHWDLDTDEWQWDEGQHRIFGVDPQRFKVSLGNIRAMIPSEDWQRVRRDARGILKGDRTMQTEFRVLRPTGEVRWCIGTAVAGTEGTKRVGRLSGVTIDVTARKEAEIRQDLLAREVDHRARNALAVVQSIIRLTRSGSIEDYIASIDGRIQALSRAHTLLSASRWDSADLGTLVIEELAPFRIAEPGRVTIEGPSVSLLPQMAQALAMALHELTTNAAKHGAFSSARGKVSVTWQLSSNSLVLRWVETTDLEIVAPSSPSFGLKVVTTSIKNQLGGKVAFDWLPQGLQCTLTIPWQPLSIAVDAAKQHNGAVMEPEPFSAAPGQRILLVEDEVLVAMMIQDCLIEWGHSVIGPASKASEALRLAENTDYDAAILDINLGDGTAYAIANVLSRRRIPFIFITGYESDSIDERFSAVPVLQKPIETQALRNILVSKPAVHR
jgi:PAS domain S-box-containing protein